MALEECSKCSTLTDSTELVKHAKRDFEPLCLDCWEKQNEWH